MMPSFPRVRRRWMSVSILTILLCACNRSASDDQQKTGSGVTIDVSTIFRGFVDAGIVVRASVRSLWSDAQQRAANITEGTQKIQEGKEQVERGIQGE